MTDTNNSKALAVASQDAGLTKREDFSGAEIVRTAETAGAAAAATARAMVEARYLMAMQRPRNIEAAWQRIIADCRRPGFAAVAIYAKPVGGQKIEGPSVRFVEGALRHLGNVHTSWRIVYDDPSKRIVNVSVTDLETNTPYDADVTIEKTIERKDTRGREVISSRQNTSGDRTFLVVATDDEMTTKTNAAVSKVRRNLGLCIIPGDIVEDAMSTCRGTRRKTDADDPDGAWKGILASFLDVRVTAAQLRDFLGHEVSQVTADERDTLRGICTAIADGETTWAAVMDLRRAEQDKEAPPKPGTPTDFAPPAARATSPEEYTARIAAATTLADLKLVGDDLAKTKLTKDQKAKLTEAYGARLFALKSAAASPPPSELRAGEVQS